MCHLWLKPFFESSAALISAVTGYPIITIKTQRIALLTIFFLFLLAGFLPDSASADVTSGNIFTVYGPQTYVRQTGKPIQVTASFSVTDLTASYTLKIYNGGSPQYGTTGERVSSAEIDLNGKQIFGPSDFNQQVNQLSLPVTPLASNTISVQLQGKPGGTLVIEIVGKRNTPPPQLSNVAPVSGPTAGGTTINLSGNNFLSGATVRFGGVVTSSTTVLNSSSISAITPSHSPGVVDISVTNPDGQTATLAGAYTYLSPPPAITGINPASGPASGGTSISITGNNFINGAVVSIGGAAATSITVVGASNITAVTPPHHPGRVDIVVTNPDGQSATRSGGYLYGLTCDPVVQDNTVPQITILTPASNTNLQTEAVYVSGNYSGPSNTAVIVNGIAAITDGFHFYANNVPLRVGANTIQAIATTPAGKTATSQVQVNSLGPDVMEVHASAAVGVSSLKVQFNITYRGSAGLQSVSADFNGDGATDLTATNLNQPLEFTYNIPGVYQAQFTLVDNAGTNMVRPIVIKIEDVNALRVTLEATYSYFTRFLVCGDVNLALSFMTAYSRDQYRPALQSLRPFFPVIISNWSPLQPSRITAEYGEFSVNETINGVNRLFFIYFVQDSDGVWRIDSM